ncbi:MAG: hypothetical protein WCC63_05465, partial [Candidatus Bathyarchaeia archaeon]
MLKTGRLTVLSISILSLLLLVSSVMAHAPLGSGDNESIDTATAIPDPTKSWAIYAELHIDGDAQYYTFNITTGQKIHTMLFKSMRSEESGFTPRLVIIGPNITEQGTIPTYVNVTIPSDAHAQVVELKEPTATYEPFSPSSFYSLSDETIDSPAAGTYYVVVYEQSSTPTGGHYGLAIGDRETYTIDEWILIPFNLMTIYQWEGQSLTLVLTPMIAAIIVGFILITWRFKKQRNLANPMAWLGAIAGLTFIGTAATTLYQMLAAATSVTVGAEALITLIFAIVPLAIGLVTLRLSIKDSSKASVKKRVYYGILGFAALFMWAGLIIGPILAILAS